MHSKYLSEGVSKSHRLFLYINPIQISFLVPTSFYDSFNLGSIKSNLENAHKTEMYTRKYLCSLVI